MMFIKRYKTMPTSKSSEDKTDYKNMWKIGFYCNKNTGLAYSYFSLDRTFMFFGFSTGKEKKQIMTGWKAHIAIDDSDSNNLAKGWNAIVGILIRYKINLTKIVAPNKQFVLSDNEFLHGKQITIYQFKNPEKTAEDWKEFFTEVTKALKDNEVIPAPISPFDMPISGSNYISYRNDADNHGHYLSTNFIRSYNQSGTADPNLHIKVNVPDQLQPKEHKEIKCCKVL